MATIWTIVQFVFVFGLIIFVHELGHYLMAVILGIPVAEFGFGYPPKLIRLFRWRGTDFTLNAIPFGGFVRFEEEVPIDETEELSAKAIVVETPCGEPDIIIEPETQEAKTKTVDSGIIGGITQAPKWKRFLILVAGPTMNFILGIIVLVIMFNAIGSPDPTRVIIADIAPNSPAAQAGLEVRDLVKTINGVKIDSNEALSNQVQANLGKEIEIVVLRESQEFTTHLIPRENPPEGEGAIGIIMDNPKLPAKFGDTLKSAFGTFWNQVKTTLTLPIQLIQGVVQPEEARIVGIKGIYDMFAYAEEADQIIDNDLPIMRLSLLSIVSIAVGITNLLPIPALDGGQILFLLIETITRKKMPERVANAINTVFFFLLIALMIFITFRDFINPIQLH